MEIVRKMSINRTGIQPRGAIKPIELDKMTAGKSRKLLRTKQIDILNFTVPCSFCRNKYIYLHFYTMLIVLTDVSVLL